MRKALSCVLMMTLLLAGCKADGGEESPENLAALIRGEYLNLTGWTACVDVNVDYGERVYEFGLDVSWKKEGDTILTITEPELVAGITARITDGVGYLEYDGVSLSTGPLNGEGMTPLEAAPFLMEQVTKGYMARCSYETEGESRLLKVLCRDPEGQEGAGTECTLYFDPESHDLLRAEVSCDGFRVLTAVLTNFTKEMTEHESGDHEDLG